MTTGTVFRTLALSVCVIFPAVDSFAETSPAQPPADAAASAPPAEDKPAFKQEELDQMLAPIALYPDSLVSQMLMASTYPIEIVQADRWVKANKELKGDAMAKELEKQDWDASVKSLVNFPEVLAAMSEKLEVTTKIGDAFIADQKKVMDTIQGLRAKANAQGNLKSNTQQNVVVEAAPAGSTTTQIIKIESSDPDVIYVPSYNPTVVYGAWSYPAYPPYPYYAPVATAAVGFACGMAWGYAMGNCNWGGGDVDIDVNRNSNRNTNIDRSKYNGGDRGGNRGGERGAAGANSRGGGAGGSGKFQHDSSHRKGMSYRDSGTANKFGGNSAARTNQARDSYRGRADTGRQNLSADRAAGRTSPSTGAGGAGANRGNAGAGASNRASPSTGASNRASGGASSGRTGASDRSALSGSNRSGASERSASSRGQSSRSSSGASRSSGGGSRGGGGGGGSRGGGGGGRGGGGGGRR